jgi:hypothetical protein
MKEERGKRKERRGEEREVALGGEREEWRNKKI